MNKELEIEVYARIGGPNRDEYEDRIVYLRKHPYFVRDYDDDFDNTFLYLVFAMPEKAKFDEDARQLFYDATTKKVGTPRERFDRILKKMQDPNTPKDDPELVNALEVGKNILAPIEQFIKEKEEGSSGDGGDDLVPIKTIEIHSDGTVTPRDEN